MNETPPAILVVDDDPEVLTLLTETLRARDHAVRAAATAEQALVLIGELPELRLLIADVRAIGMSGIELADRAQVVRPDLKVILISGWFLPQFVERRFLKKPFRTEDFIAAVAEELGEASDGLGVRP